MAHSSRPEPFPVRGGRPAVSPTAAAVTASPESGSTESGSGSVVSHTALLVISGSAHEGTSSPGANRTRRPPCGLAT